MADLDQDGLGLLIDFDNIDFNEEILDIEKEFPGYIDNIKKSLSVTHNHIIKKDNVILAIFGYIEYIKKHYYLYLIPTKQMKDNSFIAVKMIKKLTNNLLKEKKPIRVGTESLDIEYLNRWHKWLGFELEGIKKNFIGNRNYNVWRILWEQQL